MTKTKARNAMKSNTYAVPVRMIGLIYLSAENEQEAAAKIAARFGDGVLSKEVSLNDLMNSMPDVEVGRHEFTLLPTLNCEGAIRHHVTKEPLVFGRSWNDEQNKLNRAA